MNRQHKYSLSIEWVGNLGSGTSTYTGYSRDHEINSVDKNASIFGSSDPAFRGDKSRYSPEELLVAALSTCHMLWVLHLCVDRKVIVLEYRDEPIGIMSEDASGSGRFERVILAPKMKIAAGDQIANAFESHEQAHRMCFIANSVSFEVVVNPEITVS